MVSYHREQANMDHNTSLEATQPQHHHMIHSLKTSAPTSHIYLAITQVPKAHHNTTKSLQHQKPTQHP